MISLKEPKTTYDDLKSIFEMNRRNLNIKRNSHGHLAFDNGIPLLWRSVLNYDSDMTSNVDPRIRREFLERYGNFRREFVDALLRYSAQSQCLDCKASSVGSITPISDYDITVTGNKSAHVVDTFNKIFKQFFGYPSALVFDTNIYGTSFYDDCPTDYTYYKRFTTNNKYVCSVYLPDDDKIAIEQQRIWAFVKLDEYLNDENRIQFINNTVPKVQDTYKNAIELRERLQSITNINRKSIDEMNLAYIKSLMDVQARKQEMEQDITNDDVRRRYKDAISTANYYGSNTYFTQGAFLHVVGQMQSESKDISITDNEYLDSFIENMADTLKEINNFEKIYTNEQHQRENDDYDKKCRKLIHNISKYFTRAMDALINAIHLENEELIQSLKQSRKLSDTIKKEVRDRDVRTTCDDDKDICVTDKFAKELEDRFLNDLGIDNCRNVRQAMLNIIIRYINQYYQHVEEHTLQTNKTGKRSRKGGRKRIVKG